MQKLILLILVGVWAAVLLPPALKSRAQGRPGDSISDFNRHLDILRRTRTVKGTKTLRPASPAMLRRPRTLSPIGSPFPGRLAPAARLPRMSPASSMSPAARRRRDVLIGLLVVVGVSFAAAVATSDLRLWTLHVAADAMLAVFLVALVRRRNVAAIRTLTLTPPRSLDTAQRFDPASDLADDADRRLELVRSASR